MFSLILIWMECSEADPNSYSDSIASSAIEDTMQIEYVENQSGPSSSRLNSRQFSGQDDESSKDSSSKPDSYSIEHSRTCSETGNAGAAFEDTLRPASMGASSTEASKSPSESHTEPSSSDSDSDS